MANDRNAGRKPVINGVRVHLKVPKDKVKELKDFAKILQYGENINRISNLP
jgi:hypothetical protein